MGKKKKEDFCIDADSWPPFSSLCPDNTGNIHFGEEKPNKYEEALKRILDIDLGIYPKAIYAPPGEYSYKRRTLYMDGWNNASVQHAEEIANIFDELGIDTSDWE